MPASARGDEIRAELLGSKAVRLANAGDYARARALYLESIALHRGASATDPEHRRRQHLNLAFRLAGAAWAADRLGDASAAEREWQEAAGLLERLCADDPGDSAAALRLAKVELEIGQSRYRRGLLGEARDALRSTLAASEALMAREPHNERIADVLAWSALSLAHVHHAEGELADAERLREQAREIATARVAIEPASASWQGILARAQTDLGAVALARSDWAGAAVRFGAARVAYERLVSRDPTSRFYRRAAAVTIAQLAEAEAAMGRTEAARAAWLAALGHLAELARPDAPEARLEWAHGLRGYAALARRSGRAAAAREAIEHALRLVEGTPADGDRPVHVYYRAAVLAEVGSARAAQRRTAEAQQAWRRAAELLRGLAARTPLEPDWARQLRDVEAELGHQLHDRHARTR